MLLKEFDKRIKELKSSRYSVKIVLSNNYENVFKIKRVFLKYNYQLVELKDYQKNENSWFGVSTLLDIVKNLQKNSVVFGVSEIVRFYNDEEFFTFFRSLFEIEDSMKNIFIPLFGLESRFNHVFFKKFHRKDEYNYIYIIDSKNEKYELFVVDFEVPFENQLQTIKDWLEFYKKPQNNLICSPKPLVYKAKNLKSDDLIQVYKITNQHEFIEKYMHKKFPIDYRENDIEYWKRLIVDIKNSSIEQLLKNRFNLHSLTPSEILKEICNENDLYYKWLMKGYVLSQEEKDSYFYEVIKNSDVNNVLIEKVWFDIFDDYNAKYLSQRYEILKEFYKDKNPSIKIEEKLTELLKNFEHKIAMLTGTTQVEKEYIVQFYSLNKVDDRYIEKYYIDLKFYIDDVEFINNIEWVSDYFREYKESKIKNKISYTLKDILTEKNRNQDSFFTWYTNTAFKDINEFDFDKEKVLWIDGLGIEWAGIIKNYCLQKGYDCEIYLSKSKIPTITKCNRFEGAKKINSLDNYIHSQSSYNYPKSLVEEIDIVKDILNDYLEDELIIVSDHGFSAFCSFQENKINSFNGDEHEGRCARVDKLLNDDNYFSYDFECGRYLVSLNHNSLNNKTRREAHGGVTPEEVIVPIIKIYKSHKTINKPISTKQKKKKGFVEEELF